MRSDKSSSSVHDRVLAVLRREKPDRIPFIDRLEVWYKSKCHAGTLPREFNGRSLEDIHKAVGIGQQRFIIPYALRLRGTEVIYRITDQILLREVNPVIEGFPATGMPDLVPLDVAGVLEVEFITPVGKLSVRFQLTAEMLAMGVAPYLVEHLIKDESDFHIVEYILDRVEIVPRFDMVKAEEEKLGGYGYVVPMLARIPFQHILLEYLGEISLFYMLYDMPTSIERLMVILDELLTEVLHQLIDLPVPYVQFPDNLDGVMTNPKLFQKYCLPFYQRYVDLLHGQGKKVGSHTDGNIKPLLSLLVESGLDVCDSFSPTPLTECTFEEAWDMWHQGPIIWGGIPSPILEERTDEKEFREAIHHILKIVGDQPIILGVGDMVMGNNSLERVQYIANLIEEHEI